MYGIDILVEEHKNIISLTEYMRRMCCEIIDGGEPDTEEFRKGIAFARNYADRYHHGKEEKILFRIMLEKLGPAAEKLVRNGMLVEHDLGRYHITELEAALRRYEEAASVEGKLDIIAHAAAYADLLGRHIGKEDQVVYTFAERNLSDKDRAAVDKETEDFEKEAAGEEINNYLQWLQSRIK